MEEESPNMHIIVLDDSLTDDMLSERQLSIAIEKGPILLQLNEEEQQLQFPDWWDTCVSALESEKQGCLATPPDGKLPSEFVALLNMDALVMRCCFVTVSLTDERSLKGV